MTTTEFSIRRAYATDRRTTLRWVFSHVRRQKLLIGGVFFGAFSNAALAAVVPILSGMAFTAVTSGATPNYTTVAWAAVLVAASQILRGGLQLVRNASAETIGQRLERDARDELYGSLLGKSMTFHNLRPVGDTMARATNDVREVNLMLNPGINLVVGSANFLLMPLLVAPAIHWQLAAVPAAFLIAYIVALWQYLAELRPVSANVRASFGALNSRLAEAIEGIETVKAAAQEPAEVGRFQLLARAYRDNFVRQGRIEARYIPLLLLGLANAAGFTHALALANSGSIVLGDVIAYMGLLTLYGFPVFVSLYAYSQVSLGLASAERILELIRAESELDENAGGHHESMRGAVTFEHVGFGYTAGSRVLQDINLHVEPGQTVAIVGQTGAGKTTLVKLINRIYEASSGRVLVDGVPVRDWQLADLRRQISIIEQDLFLFSRSIAENIAFGMPGATQQQVEAAARAAQAHDFILAFADGYQTVIGERGVTLSGGQRQRLAIARAFLTRPRILILDDSTSAIDSATEDQIQRAIRDVARQQTTFLITHRLSQIRWADVIVVLRHGRIAAAGRHADLLRISPDYRSIFARYESGST
ncbi:MAG: ABC transporter ATP-binding protein [Chloroflexi bacterium]|nr:ABC transporter ATP-binding protein [Chloroflexota bacterium]